MDPLLVFLWDLLTVRTTAAVLILLLLSSSPPSDFMNVYFQIRSNQLDRSIKGLKDHFRKNSASSGILYSPAVQTKRKDTPTKKAPKRPGQQRWRLLRRTPLSLHLSHDHTPP